MYQLGHYGAALIAYAPLGAGVAIAGYEFWAVLGGLLCVSLSTLPDCDHQLPFVPHRGPTHSIPFAILVGGGLAGASYVVLDATTGTPEAAVVEFLFVVGTLSIVSHLLADALTPMGITPFWPLSRRHYTLNVTPAKSRLANYALFGLGIGAVVLAAMVVSTLS
ncbi:metal-dependent hydrolase [Natronosalvus vescus]|uniref:metal-dependent hydrolase n=1 Tax=Natronosalvus vescus TaxID=2953881 RepID=UPI002090DFF2|nr:metal-dependent hydrolase [Natronosalvus vescus]